MRTNEHMNPNGTDKNEASNSNGNVVLKSAWRVIKSVAVIILLSSIIVDTFVDSTRAKVEDVYEKKFQRPFSAFSTSKGAKKTQVTMDGSGYTMGRDLSDKKDHEQKNLRNYWRGLIAHQCIRTYYSSLKKVYHDKGFALRIEPVFDSAFVEEVFSNEKIPLEMQEWTYLREHYSSELSHLNLKFFVVQEAEDENLDQFFNETLALLDLFRKQGIRSVKLDVDIFDYTANDDPILKHRIPATDLDSDVFSDYGLRSIFDQRSYDVANVSSERLITLDRIATVSELRNVLGVSDIENE